MEIFQFDGFTLDVGAMSLRDGNGALLLRPKSFDLLTFMLRNRGLVLTKDALLAAVWPGVIVTEDSLAQCVTDIRRTLGPAGERLIRTVPGRGYALDATRVRTGQGGGDETEAEPARIKRCTIVVEPFADLSPEGNHAWFARAMAEEVQIALSRIPDIVVMSPGHARSQDLAEGAEVQTARLSGPQFALEGTVRVQAGQLRVTARIVDNASGGHIWSERYDAPLAEIFAVQDEITRQVALSAQVQLTVGDSARLWDGQTRSLKAWERIVEGRRHFHQFNRADNLRAAEAFAAALDIDPACTGAMVMLGLCHWWRARFDLSIDADEALRQADAVVDRVRGVDPGNGITYMLEGGIAHLRDQHADALRLCRAALKLAPSDAHSTAFCGYICSFAGLSEEGSAWLRQAMRLSPQYPPWYDYHLALANLWTGQLETALRLIEGYHERVPDDPYGFAMLAFAAGSTGDSARASRVVARLAERFPDFGLGNLERSEHYADPNRKRHLLMVLREAGLRN